MQRSKHTGQHKKKHPECAGKNEIFEYTVTVDTGQEPATLLASQDSKMEAEKEMLLTAERYIPLG